ncbi:MAG: hypothetical protein QOG67_3554 [Verrucomicrobiota bacterium]|jgi:type II secretory pathway pseudopilin PulG
MKTRGGFTLVEVVLALGIVAFAIVAILGMLPIGLNTSHGAQDNTRAPQIAQSIFATLAAQAIIRDPITGDPVVDVTLKTNQLNNSTKIPQVSNTAIDLTKTSKAPYQLYADNDGQVSDSKTSATYAVGVTTDTSPTGFDAAGGAQVTVSVSWPLNAAPTNQVKRDFVRVISRY